MAATGEALAAAERILMDLMRETPDDGDLKQALKNLSARKTLDEGGYGALEGGRGSFRDILKNKEEAVSLEQEKRVQKSEDVTERLIGEYETRLQTEPNNLKLIRSLAELYTQKKQFDRALELYDRVKNSDMGNDPSLDHAIANTIVRQFDFQIAAAEPLCAGPCRAGGDSSRPRNSTSSSPNARSAWKNIPPTSPSASRWACSIFRPAKSARPSPEFQKAQGNPHKRLAAMSFLAQCFAKRKMFDLAARTLQNAIKEKPVFDDEKKDLIYNLGCVLRKHGQKRGGHRAVQADLRNGHQLQGRRRQGGRLLRGAVKSDFQCKTSLRVALADGLSNSSALEMVRISLPPENVQTTRLSGVTSIKSGAVPI